MPRAEMRISFLLPGAGREPVGGFKVVYEYANGLTRRGHHVTVVHTARTERELDRPARLRRTGAYFKRKLNRDVGPARWFPLDSRVRVLWAPSLSASYVPDGDVVVATAWQTAEWVPDYPSSKGRKIYFIQHLETWSGTEARVLATWKLPLEKIVTAKWLRDVAESMGETASYIPLGLDFNAFGMDVTPESRRADSCLMLHHTEWWKGSQDGIMALEQVRKEYPDMLVDLYGTGPEPELPRGFRYHRDPPQVVLRSLYNRTAIFVAPSVTEGWGLPATEAMMCGAALAATDNGGHREFARHEETALLSPPEDPESLARNLLRLVTDHALRFRLARDGHAFVQQFTWDRALDRFESLLGTIG